MIPGLPLKPDDIERLSLSELRVLQQALYNAAVGNKQQPEKHSCPHDLASHLPEIEPDPFEDITESLAQLGGLLAALGQELNKPGVSVAERINLEDAQLVLIRRREQLRREWHALLTWSYPPSN